MILIFLPKTPRIKRVIGIWPNPNNIIYPGPYKPAKDGPPKNVPVLHIPAATKIANAIGPNLRPPTKYSLEKLACLADRLIYRLP